MICNLTEVIESKRMLNEAAESLEKEGIPFNCDLQIGVLVEVPSAVIMADHLADEVDFFSIGTNDLIQYALAIDRGNRQVNHLFRPLDPAVLRLIKQVCDVGQEKNVKVFMCGEMAGYAIHLPVLLAMGMDELSMNPQSMPTVKRMTRALSLEHCRQLLPEIMKRKTAEEVYHLLQEQFGDILADIEGH
jgi:phosphotransferase system enzyme I (PtsI)